MQRIFAATIAACACTLGAGIAHATDVSVTVSETDKFSVNQIVASWTQNQNPVPDAFVQGYYTTVPVFDAVGLGGDSAVTWYSSSNAQLGGFTNYNEDFNVLAQLSYAAGENTPVFLPGSYSGVDIKPDFTYVAAYYTIALVSEPSAKPAFGKFDAVPLAAAVPEPASWAIMIVGLGAIGLAARRRRKVAVSYG